MPGRMRNTRLLTITPGERDQAKKFVQSPLVSEAARLLKKDWVVKQKCLGSKFTDQVSRLKRYEHHFDFRQQKELAQLKKGFEQRLVVDSRQIRAQTMFANLSRAKEW